MASVSARPIIAQQPLITYLWSRQIKPISKPAGFGYICTRVEYKIAESCALKECLLPRNDIVPGKTTFLFLLNKQNYVALHQVSQAVILLYNDIFYIQITQFLKNKVSSEEDETQHQSEVAGSTSTSCK